MYYGYQLNQALAWPVNRWAGFVRDLWSHPKFPIGDTTFGRAVASAGELLERVTRRYPGAPFGLETTRIDGRLVGVREATCLETPFCNLVRFERDSKRDDPKVLLVAPLSGHHASLMRETVERLIPDHDLYVTDWIDARLVPLSKGRFDLDDYIDLLQRFIRHIGPDVHVIAVCQSCVPVLAAVALMEESGDPSAPRSMTLMSGPIDTRVSPTGVNRFVASSPLALFELTAVHRVPLGQPGFLRKVYPGFLQLAGIVSADSARHLNAHQKLYLDLVGGDEESAKVHRRFYDDYLAVIDLPAEYYLETVKSVFQRHALARGEMTWRGTRRVRPDLIRTTALMTVEGAADDITPVGQTSAAHGLCTAIPSERRQRLVVPGVGHFGVFRGRRWREVIAPRVGAFIRSCDRSMPARDVRPALVAMAR
jgi:poly(3-hydroxybutyrate) depolymerase